MNKKICFFTPLLVLIMFLVGCANIEGNGTYIDNTVGEKCELSIMLGSGVRSILPEEFEGPELFYTLEGKSVRGNILPVTTLNFDPITNEAKIPLEYDTWELTLIAYKDEEHTLPVLKGYRVVDLTNGETLIHFDLKTYDLTTVGEIALSGNFVDEEDAVTKYVMTLKNFETDAIIEERPVEHTGNGTEEYPFTFAKQNLLPGTYLFAVKFIKETTKDGNPVEEQIGYWSEIVVVDAGNDTTKDDILIDVIMRKPSVPTDLQALLIEDSKSKDRYNVKLTWTDTSDNEENFVITVKEYADTTDAEGTEYRLLDETFIENDIRVDGSLLSGNTSCIISLPTGRLFDVVIQAENTIGISAECARVDATDTTGFTGYKASNKINLMNITYDLDRGQLQLSGDLTKTGEYLEYHIYKGTDIPLLEIKDPLGAEYPKLTKNNNPWLRWEDRTDAKNPVTITTATFKNVYVKAIYDQTFIISYTIEGYEDLAAARVIATYDDTTTPGVIETTEAKNAKIARNTKKDITIGIKAAVGDETKYSKFKLYIDDKKVTENDTMEYTVSTTDMELDIGTHTVMVCAYDETIDQWFSHIFAITITN